MLPLHQRGGLVPVEAALPTAYLALELSLDVGGRVRSVSGDVQISFDARARKESLTLDCHSLEFAHLLYTSNSSTDAGLLHSHARLHI